MSIFYQFPTLTPAARLKWTLCSSLLMISSCSSGNLDADVSHKDSYQIEITSLSGNLAASINGDNEGDIGASSVQNEPVNDDFQTSDQVPSAPTDSFDTQSPISLEDPPAPQPQPQVVTSTNYTFTLDLSKQTIGSVDLVIAIDNSASMGQHIRKFEAGFSNFLTTTASKIDGTLNTTVLSCSRNNQVTSDDCLTITSSLTSQIYHVPLTTITDGNRGLHWFKNIIQGYPLITKSNDSPWVTIDRTKVFTQNYKKFFLVLTNDAQYDSAKSKQLKSATDTHLGNSNVNFASIKPMKKDNDGCKTYAAHDKHLKSLTKHYGGKPYHICADANAYQTYFTDITSRIKTLSWGSINIASLSDAQRKRIAKVTLAGTVYDHAIQTIAGSPLLFVDVPHDTADGAQIIVTVNDP